MAEYEILTKEHMYVDEYIDGYARHERGRIYDVIEAETPGKAKYLFWKKHFCYDFIEDMKLIEMCRLHRCPRCKGQVIPEGYDYDDWDCQFCRSD